MPETSLLDKVKRHLRIDGSEDDIFLASLVSAARQYLLNAGVQEPVREEDDGNGQLALYDLAVSLYVSMIYDGDEESKIDRAMTAIILQLKLWRR